MSKVAILFLVAGVVLIIIPYTWQLWLLKLRGFNPDEFEHLHVAWCISQGLLPYRDFFEHHTPLFHFFLAPFFRFFNVETSFNDAVRMLLFSRLLMWIFTGLILALTFRLGQLWCDWQTGLMGTVFVVNTLMFLQKTLEIRPDLISVSCWLGCLLLLIQAIRSEDVSAAQTMGGFAGSGVFLGMAVLTSQKTLLAMPGFALAMLWYGFDPRSPGSLRARSRNLLGQFAGLCLPVLLMLGYFASRGGFVDFIEFNFLLNLRWKRHPLAYDHLCELAWQNPLLVTFSIVGVISILFRLFQRESLRRGDYLLIINGIGIFMGVFLIPTPQTQYFLMFIPLMGLLAASFLFDVVNLIEKLRYNRIRWDWLPCAYGGILATLTGIALWYFLIKAKPQAGSPKFYWESWIIAIIVGFIWVMLRWRYVALVPLLIVMSLYSLKQLEYQFIWKNEEQLASLRFVLEHTSPNETCMDGFSGLGVFRPHAYFYWMPHAEVQKMLTAEERQQLFEKLRSGEIAPKLVILDGSLRALSPQVTKFLEENYRPTGRGSIRLRSNDSLRMH